MLVHVVAGGIGIISGAVALVVTKGGRVHRTVGNAFFVSMLIMSAIGATASPFLQKPQWSNVFIGALTFYLVATSWMTIRRKEGGVGRFEFTALFVAVSIGVAALIVGTLAIRSPAGLVDGLSYQSAFAFGVIWSLVAIADLRNILRGGVIGAARTLRHLWRMCVPLLIAVTSLFIGQSKVFPQSVRELGVLYVPSLVVLGLSVYWIVRLRFTKRWFSGRARRDSPAT